jgi:hypothetical protein
VVIRLNEPLFSDMSPAEDAGSLLLSLCFNLQILLDHQSSVSFQNNSPTDQMEGYKSTSGISKLIFTLIPVTVEQLVNQISKVIKKLSPNQTIEVNKTFNFLINELKSIQRNTSLLHPYHPYSLL